MRTRTIALTLLLVAIAPLEASTAERVILRRGRVSVDVIDMAWPAFLDEFRKGTGIAVEIRSGIEGSVTAVFQDLEIAPALRRLFGEDASFVSFYEAGPADRSSLPSTVWVLAGGGAARPEPAPAAEDSPDGADLESDDPAARQPTPETLGPQERAPAVSALFQVMTSDPDPDVRITAASMLAKIGTPEAFAALRGVLADPEVHVRLQAVDTLLGVRGRPAAVILREALNDPDERVRAAAAAALDGLDDDGG